MRRAQANADRGRSDHGVLRAGHVTRGGAASRLGRSTTRKRELSRSSGAHVSEGMLRPYHTGGHAAPLQVGVGVRVDGCVGDSSPVATMNPRSTVSWARRRDHRHPLQDPLPGIGGAYRSDQVTVFRLPFFAQESPLRRAREWLTMAENWWPHDGRKLTISQVQRRRESRHPHTGHPDHGQVSLGLSRGVGPVPRPVALDRGPLCRD